MTISVTSSQVTVAATGASSYSFPMIGVATSDISVLYTATNGTITTVSPTAYTVSLNAPVTGSIWGVGGNISPVTPSNYTSGSLTIIRTLPFTQQAEISNQGNQYPIVTETALDTLCMEIQQVAARTGAYRGVWVTGTVYNFGDIVQDGVNGAYTNNIYVAAQENTSGVWATDLAAGDWVLAISVATLQPPGSFLPLAGGTVSGNLTVSGTTTLSALTASELVATDGSKNLTNVTALPSGTTATTQTAGDNSTNVATTANLGNWRAAVGYSSNTTLTSSNYGTLVEVSGSSTTITLPASANGAMLAFFNTGAAAVTIAGSSNINIMGQSGLSSIALGIAQTAIFVGDGTSWNWIAGSGIGVAQAWTDVTASRAVGTVYTNSTGRPISVSVWGSGPSVANYTTSLLVNGVTIADNVVYQPSGGGIQVWISGIVPPGSTYEIIVSGASYAVSKWFELR